MFFSYSYLKVSIIVAKFLLVVFYQVPLMNLLEFYLPRKFIYAINYKYMKGKLTIRDH